MRRMSATRSVKLSGWRYEPWRTTMATNNRHTGLTMATHHQPVRDPFQVMQRAFDSALDNFFDKPAQEKFFSRDWEHLSLTPSLDVMDEGKYLKVIAELPGMAINDIKISLDSNVLTTCGEKTLSTNSSKRNKNYLSREIGYGRYLRSVTLPKGLNVDKAKATFDGKGMLWIEIPKRYAKALTSKKRCIKVAAAK